jgi:hypothetical protein
VKLRKIIALGIIVILTAVALSGCLKTPTLNETHALINSTLNATRNETNALINSTLNATRIETNALIKSKLNATPN